MLFHITLIDGIHLLNIGPPSKYSLLKKSYRQLTTNPKKTNNIKKVFLDVRLSIMNCYYTKSSL